MELDAAAFTIIDVETTGLNAGNGDRVCEVGAIKIQAGREVGRFETLINPERDIPEPARATHKITEEMVKDQPTFATIASKLRPFLAGCVLVAQNAEFDMGFLNSEFVRAGMSKLSSPAVCTILLARRVRPGLSTYRLDSLAHHFGLKFTSRHRSMGDCEVTAKVFLECLKALRQRGEVRSVEDLVKKGGIR